MWCTSSTRSPRARRCRRFGTPQAARFAPITVGGATRVHFGTKSVRKRTRTARGATLVQLRTPTPSRPGSLTADVRRPATPRGTDGHRWTTSTLAPPASPRSSAIAGRRRRSPRSSSRVHPSPAYSSRSPSCRRPEDAVLRAVRPRGGVARQAHVADPRSHQRGCARPRWCTPSGFASCCPTRTSPGAAVPRRTTGTRRSPPAPQPLNISEPISRTHVRINAGRNRTGNTRRSYWGARVRT
jgi:hypothetical protein